jgi:hypothetical protein
MHTSGTVVLGNDHVRDQNRLGLEKADLIAGDTNVLPADPNEGLTI